MVRTGLCAKPVSSTIEATAPALLPHALADGAGDARSLRGRRNDARLRNQAGDLQHQLGADGIAELVPLANRNDESAGAADHAILVVDVELGDIHGRRVGP